MSPSAKESYEGIKNEECCKAANQYFFQRPRAERTDERKPVG
jgi:hypothetical protein